MALKGDRNVIADDISFFLNEVAERGVVVVLSTAGSGAALDQSQALVTVAANPSGKQPIGVLLSDMVNKDLTRQHINWHKSEVQIGGKVPLMTRGWVVTNRIVGTPTAGQSAYLGVSGLIQGSVTSNVANTPLIGRFLSTKDEDGYAKVEVNLPMAQVQNPL